MSALKKFIGTAFLTASLFVAQAQVPKTVSQPPIAKSTIDSNAVLIVTEISVSGNKQTKDYIILREVPFKKGDTLYGYNLSQKLEDARRLVYNTTLFTEVKVQENVGSNNELRVSVTVSERWYIYPIPQFQLVDRNFNDWIKTHKASFSRVNYGVKFVHFNLSGRRDQLKIYLTNGYSRNISFSYTAPYSNSALTEGFGIAAGFRQNREVSYKTSYNNRVLFYPGDSLTRSKAEFVRRDLYVNMGYIIRRGYFNRHIFNLGYTHSRVRDSIVMSKYNPRYFNDSSNSKGYPDLTYTYQYVNVDNVAYALKGRSGFFSASKRGLGFSGGVNGLTLEAGYNRYFSHGKKWYSSFNLSSKLRLPLEQAYINQRGLGYGESYLRGLEYYVIDGVATALARTTLKKKLFSFQLPLPFSIKSLKKIPFTIFAKTFADAGYVYNKPNYQTLLSNRFLYSGGFGIDILSLYDVNLRLEYSFNQLGENGLFLHTQSGF